MKIKVAITQMHCDDNYENNINRAEQLVRKAASEGANVILLQELFEGLYFCQVEDYDKFSLAEERNNCKAIKHFQKIAKELKELNMRPPPLRRASAFWYNKGEN